MSQIKILLFSLFLVGLTFQLYAQTTIWEENFDSYANGTTSSSKWTIDASGVTPPNYSNFYCSVQQSGSDKYLDCKDANGGTVIWQSQQITTPSNTKLSISMQVDMGGNLEPQDYIKAEYRIDGGTWQLIDELSNDFSGPVIFSKNIANSGSTIEIRITMSNGTYNGRGRFEHYYVDNISIIRSGKILWLRADAGVSQSGSQVISWLDQSGNNNGVQQTASNRQPKLANNQINFNPVVEFNGINEFLAGTSGGFYTDNYFVVFKPAATINQYSSGMVLIDGIGTHYTADGDLSGLFLGDGTNAFNNEVITHGVGSRYDFRSALTGTTSFPSTAYLVNATENAQATDEDVYLNGSKINNAQSGNYIKESNIDYYIGGRGDYLSVPMYYQGQIAEIIDYNGRISDAERWQVQSYLAIKYGITLTTNNYLNSNGSLIYDRSSYGNNIAGLGHDSNFNLNQKVSSSINTNNTQSSDITIATTADFTSSNQNTSRTSLTDGQYLIWGDNNGQTTSWSTDGSYQRVGRWWKIQNTGSVGEVHLQINLNSYPALPASNSYALIVDNNGNLSDGGVDNVFPLSTSGNNLYTTTVTFPPGTHYFTIEAIQPLSLSTSVNKNVSCNSGNDGEISASATGGSGSYTFYLNSVETTFPASNLAAGTYNVKVTSGSETKSQTLTITEPGKLMNTLPDITNVKCKGDHTGAVDIHIPYPVKFSSASNDYIDLGGSFLNGVSSFTMEGWIKFNKADLAGLTRIGLFGQNDIIEFGFSNSTTIQFWTAHGGSCSVPLSQYPDDNGWHHIAAVGTGSQLIVYIDGVQAGNIHYTTSSYGSSSFDVTIGGYVYDPIGSSSSHSFPGEIRKVGFWNKALSQNDIQNIVNSNRDYTGTESNLLAGYNFFEGTGNKITPVGSTTTSGTFGNSTTWDTNAYTFKWSKSGTQITTTEDLSGISAGDYSLIVTSTDGCEQSETYSVTEPSSGMNITLSASPPTHAECVGTPVSFSTSVTGGTAPLNYDFMIDATSAQSGTQSTYDYNTLSGNKSITVKATDANGCASISSGYSINGSNAPTTGIIVKN